MLVSFRAQAVLSTVSGLTIYITPVTATVGSLLAFYVATAAYRAFRAKNTESVVLLVSAIIVMVGMAPIGYLLSPRFPAIADWLINIMNMSGQRGIMITAGIGGIAASIRVLVGIDRR